MHFIILHQGSNGQMKFVILNILILLGFSIDVKPASFDCTADLNITEKTICSNTALNLLDEKLSELYSIQIKALIKTNRDSFIGKQRTWLSSRNNKCISNINCLATSYASKIQELSLPPEKIEKTQVNFSYVPNIQSFKAEKKCGFSTIEFAENLIVYAGGAYSGVKTNFQIDQSGSQATRFDVAINSPDAPVALILGAYEASVWRIKWTENTKILAVYAMGNHRQIVTGLPNNVPVITSSSWEKPNCHDNLYISPKTVSKINPIAKYLFDKRASLVALAKNGKLVFGSAFSSTTALFTNADNTVEDYIDPSMPLAGPAGLDDLVSKG